MIFKPHYMIFVLFSLSFIVIADEERKCFKAIDKVGFDKGFDQCMFSARQGDPESQYGIGEILSSANMHKEAFEWYIKAAEQGHASAQFEVGSMLGSGKGVKKNAKESFNWYEKSAKQGHVFAETMLGAYYEHGVGVPQNYKLSYKWNKSAAQKGNPGAQLNLGYIYGNGLGVQRDVIKAYAWTNLAATYGLETAIKNREKLLSSMSPKEIEQAQSLSGELFKNYSD